jgi:hypothetical protein
MCLSLGKINIITDEASRINYRLRSTFFYRKLKEYKILSFQAKIAALLIVQDSYSWEDWKNWAIGEDTFAYISKHSELELIQVFCHPCLIR